MILVAAVLVIASGVDCAFSLRWRPDALGRYAAARCVVDTARAGVGHDAGPLQRLRGGVVDARTGGAGRARRRHAAVSHRVQRTNGARLAGLPAPAIRDVHRRRQRRRRRGGGRARGEHRPRAVAGARLRRQHRRHAAVSHRRARSTAKEQPAARHLSNTVERSDWRIGRPARSVARRSRSHSAVCCRHWCSATRPR